MPVRRQLSIFLENKPGVMARLCGSLAQAKINLLALSVTDSVDCAIVRLIVSDPEKAQELLEARGVLVVVTEVLAVSLANHPGALQKVAQALAKAKVNIEYSYGAAMESPGEATLIMRVNDLRKARKALKL